MGKAIQALSRIGDVLYVEPLDNGLSFRTVDSKKSAYAMVQFCPKFFVDYIVGNSNEEDGDDLKCKVAMKSCQAVFKPQAIANKQIESFQIIFDNANSNKLVFLMKCRHDVVKTHYLTILDSDTLQAVYTKENVPNTLKIRPNLLIEALNNFQASDEEITIEAHEGLLRLRNYDINTKKQSRLRSEVELKPNEFEDYNITHNTSVTFNMKELRAVLIFAEFIDLPIRLSFETTGKPIVFIISNDSTFEANFVMATTEPDIDEEYESQQSAVPAVRNECTAPSGDVNASLFDFVKSGGPHQHHLNPCTMQSNSPELSSLNVIVADHHMDSEQTNLETTQPAPRPPPQVAQSPTTDLIRKVFRRCFEPTYNPALYEPSVSQVIAHDSDNE